MSIRGTEKPKTAEERLTEAEIKRLYELMVKTRFFNEKATSLQRQGRIHNFLGCLGQEAAILGSACALEAKDWIFPSYREHSIPLLRGIRLKELFNHLIGNGADRVKGRNIPPEYSFRDVNCVSISAPVGTQFPQAVGVARAARIKGHDIVTMVYAGEGATSEGDFHVALNFAGVWNAPVVFFIQNNGWAISVPAGQQTASESFAIKAEAYGFKGEIVDGNDLTAVYKTCLRAVKKARKGEGPTLIEARTYRLGPHSTSDDPKLYQDEIEVIAWKTRDPILLLEQSMRKLGYWSKDFGEQIRQRARQEVQEAANQALAEPLPTRETLFQDVYHEMPWHLREQMKEFQA
ncbi:MAG: 3-methyl-2-oxobutanoate dehydrogenase [Acidobacteria bacterium]|nr:3-methyl-2-oxobutanoate dehydrogenase [Acidobacteriota bacterium]